MKSRIG